MGDAVEFIKEDGSILEVDVQKAAAPRPSNSLPMPKRIDGPTNEPVIKNPPVKNIQSDIKKSDIDVANRQLKEGKLNQEQYDKRMAILEKPIKKEHDFEGTLAENERYAKEKRDATYKIKPDLKSPPHSEFRSPHPVKKAEGDYRFKRGEDGAMADPKVDRANKYLLEHAQELDKKQKVNSALKKALQVIVPALQEEMMADIEKSKKLSAKDKGFLQDRAKGAMKGEEIHRTDDPETMKKSGDYGKTTKGKTVHQTSDVQKSKSTPKSREMALRNKRLDVVERVISPNKTKAALSVKKAITIIEGYSPMDDQTVMKSFNGIIPDVMKDIEMRPPTMWWNEAITKSSEFTEFPAKFSMDLWYRLEKSEDSTDDEISKAVAENLISPMQPVKRGENNSLSDGSKLKVSDLAGPGKSNTDVSY